MKDLKNHRKYLQKKVLQAVKKESKVSETSWSNNNPSKESFKEELK